MAANPEFEAEVQEAMRILQSQRYGAPAPAMESPDTNPEFEAEVQEAMQMLQQNPGLSVGQRAGQVARGLAKGVGNVGDILAAPGSGFSTQPAFARINQNMQMEPVAPQPPEYAKKLTGMVDKLAGQNLEPTDTLGKVLEGTGDFLTPFPGSALTKIGKGVKPLATALRKEVPAALGASTGVHATPSFYEEGTIGHSVQNIAKAILGGVAGGKIGSMATKQTLREIPKALNPKRFAARVISKGSKPNKEVFDVAEREGINLPVGVGMDNKTINFIEKNWMRSIFSSRAYKDAMQKSSDDMVNTVKKSIDTLGDSALKPQEASHEYRAFLNAEEREVAKAANKLYSKAEKVLKPDDFVQPKETSVYIRKWQDRLKKADIIAPKSKKVLQTLHDLGAGMGILEPIAPEMLEAMPKKYADKIFEAFEQDLPKVHVSRLEANRKQLSELTDHGMKKTGYENILNGLRRSIEKDMAASTNKKYVSRLNEAREFFRENVAARFRGDMARSLLNGEAPAEAFNQMDSVRNIRILKKISGESEKGRELFNALSKAKVRDIMHRAVQEEGISTANFTNLFSKGEKNQELLAELLGKQEYKRLEDISKITKEFQKAGREVLNTSGTAIAAHDLNQIMGLVKGVFRNNIWSIGGASAAGATSGFTGPAATWAATDLTSRLLVNKNFVKYAHEYALARQAGDALKAKGLLNRMVQISEPMAKETLKNARFGAQQAAQEKEHE